MTNFATRRDQDLGQDSISIVNIDDVMNNQSESYKWGGSFVEHMDQNIRISPAMLLFYSIIHVSEFDMFHHWYSMEVSLHYIRRHILIWRNFIHWWRHDFLQTNRCECGSYRVSIHRFSGLLESNLPSCFQQFNRMNQKHRKWIRTIWLGTLF